MHVFVSLTARKCMCTCMCGEGGVAPPREGGNTYKRGREEMIAGIFFFPLSNKQSAETRNNCKFIFTKFVLFCRKKIALAKNIGSYSESGLSI